jgi:ubiquinone/menaquinone biosynthesis C-methylase UbiE
VTVPCRDTAAASPPLLRSPLPVRLPIRSGATLDSAAKKYQRMSWQTISIHLTRYTFAALCARPGRLLDIACGSGYRTKLLAAQSQGVIKAVGVDISEDAIAYARNRYRDARVEFIAADATNFTDPEGFDTIV